MHSLLDEADIMRDLPAGIPLGTDTGALATGRLLGLDIPNRLAQVTVSGSDPVWVPALPAIYTPDTAVRLLRSPLDGGRLSMCLMPMQAGGPIAGGEVKSINSTAGTMSVTTLGADFTLPYNAGTYTVGAKVHVLRDANQFGAPVIVLGPQGNFVAPDSKGPGGGEENPKQLVTREAVIQAQWSGSWRGGYSRWGSWQPDRFGGPSTLYQGNAYGSTQMTGLATYGDQIVGLNAVSIERMQVNVYRSDTSTSNSIAPVLQPSPNGSFPGGAPATSGDTATGPALPQGGYGQVDLPSSVFDGFRTGAFKGLATVGGNYAAFLGTSRADAMAIKVQYKVLA